MSDVDTLIEKTSVDRVLRHFGQQGPAKADGEHRMQCVFNEACHESQYGHLTVRLDDPVNRIYCHCCGVRGNLLTLIHGLATHQPPAGNRLRGDEFKQAVQILRTIGNECEAAEPSVQSTERPAGNSSSLQREVRVNVPLIRHEKEAARKLADLHDDLVFDVAQMSPEAAQYVRARPWMTAELLSKWGVGWIPGNGRSLFRKSYLVYTHRNERGEVISYSGRDLGFEGKWDKWHRSGRPAEKKPNKHRYVSGFRRGLELYGGQAERLKESYVRESLARRGIVVVEGMNEVLRMETLGVAAVGLGSNKATAEQVEKLVRFARSAGDNRAVLLPDCDEEGESAFRDLLWQLSEAKVNVRLGMSSRMFDGKYATRQPESLSLEEWNEIDAALAV